METRRLIAIVVALGALTLGILTGCGGSTDATGTLGGEVTIGTGTNPTETPVAEGDATTAAETTEAAGETTVVDVEGDAAAGAAVFTSAGCGGCHTLAAAGSAGAVGPNLDEAMPDYALVMERVTNGMGAMPAYAGQISETDIQNVSAYVSQNAGK